MATIRAHGSFVPFTLPLQDDGRVGVLEDILSSRFNLQTGTMCLEQEMFSADGQVCETIMIQKNTTDDGSMWILGPSSFKIIGLSESQMQASTVVLTNQSGTSTIQMSNVANVNLEPNDNTVCLLLEFDDNICATVDLSDTLSFPFKNILSQVFLHASKSSCTPLSKRFVCCKRPSQRPPLHPSPSSIVDTLKLTKSKKRSKSNPASIDFDNIDVHDVKYLPSSFDGEILLILPPVPFGVPSTYSRSMDGMDKMCDGHPWCTTKTTNIQNNFGLSFRRPTCADHLQCQNDHCNYMHRNEGMRNSTEWAGSTHLPFVVGDVVPAISTFECKVCRSPPVCIVLCHARIIYIHSTSVGMSRLAFILVYMIIMWLMAHAVNHWTWHTNALQMKY